MNNQQCFKDIMGNFDSYKKITMIEMIMTMIC